MGFKPHGIIPAMVTPLDHREEIDEGATRRVVNYLIEGGIHGIFVVGTQGEAYALNHKERNRVIEITVDECRGRVPVYAGTGAITTRETIALTQAAERIGADVVSIITPFFISPSSDELYEHFVAIARATRLPIVLYVNSGRTGVGLSPALVVKLSKIDNIVGVKDSSGDMSQTIEYISRTDPDFSVLMGRDTLIYSSLLVGSKGAIAATANVAPRLVVEIYEAYMADDLKRAQEAQLRLAPLRHAFGLGTFPVVIKEAMALLGLCTETARSPVRPLPDTEKTKVTSILQEIGVLA